ncbi:hypothetical protein BH18VER1_BH18VER1_12240 [soil metagenome]
MNSVANANAAYTSAPATEAITSGAALVLDEPALPAGENLPSEVASQSADVLGDPRESLFEHVAWVYILFREKLFRDDTERLVRALWPEGPPPAATRVVEIGCGPGLYSCALAARFPQISMLGIDRSARQLDWARQKARAGGLGNCCFHTDDVLNLSHPSESFNAVIAARLFTVLPDPERAIAEMHRILRPGGRCVIAEPRYALWASLPLFAMWGLARLTGSSNGCREPRRAKVLSSTAFENLFMTQSWHSVRTWDDGRYQYALCEKR